MQSPFPKLTSYTLPEDAAFSHKGSPKCDTWVIITQLESSNTELMALLSKILNAVKLNMDKDVFVLASLPNRPFYLYRMYGQSRPATVISFGPSAQDLGFNMNPILYDDIKVDKIRYLFSHDLRTIQDQAQMKKMLWAALKSIFQ